jgi:hypothetical protein
MSKPTIDKELNAALIDWVVKHNIGFAALEDLEDILTKHQKVKK